MIKDQGVGYEMQAIILAFYAELPMTPRNYAARMVMRLPSGGSCTDCNSLVVEMNQLGPDGCRTESERLVDRMFRNAVRFSIFNLATLAESQIKSQLQQWLDLAITRAQKHEHSH